MYVQTPRRVTHGGISTPLYEGGENSDNRAILTLAPLPRVGNNPSHFETKQANIQRSRLTSSAQPM